MSEPNTSSGTIALLVVSPRVPDGLLTREAWQCLERADQRLAREVSAPLVEAVQDTGLSVHPVGELPPEQLAARLVEIAESGADVVWLGSADADPGLTDSLAQELTSMPEPPTVEVVVGSWDTPGARLLDAVAVMDTLRSPGGCPWDAQQTHASLAPYLVEESFETLEAIAEKDSHALQEELGDVLLQVLFHARVAAERTDDGFDIDGVAAGLVEKLLRRHPHVFGHGQAKTPQEVEEQWAQIKAKEKPERDAQDPFNGIPSGLPPLERAAKMVARATKHGYDDAVARAASGDSLGAALLDLVVQARELGAPDTGGPAGIDPSVALSATLADLEREVRADRHASTPDLGPGRS